MIQQLAEAVAALLKLRKEEPAQVEQAIAEVCERLLGVSLKLLDTFDVPSVAELLREKHKLHALAELWEQRGRARAERGDVIGSRLDLERVLELLKKTAGPSEHIARLERELA